MPSLDSLFWAFRHLWFYLEMGHMVEHHYVWQHCRCPWWCSLQLGFLVEVVGEEQMHSSEKYSSYIAGSSQAGFDERNGTHYVMDAEPVGIAHCCKSTQDVVDA